MKKLLILLLFVSSCSNINKSRYFVCDILNGNLEETIDPNRPFDGTLNYWDRVFYYKKIDEGQYEHNFAFSHAHEFPFSDAGLGAQFNENILSDSYLETATKQGGFYREVFDVYRFNIETRMLTYSYVYYVSPEDYNKNFNKPLFTPYNNPLLFDLINKDAPRGYVKIGWDKTRWQCYNISHSKYLLLSLKFLMYSSAA